MKLEKHSENIENNFDTRNIEHDEVMAKENYSANLINPEEMRDINEDIVEKNNIEHTTIIYDKRLYQDGQKMKAIGNVFLINFFSFCKIFYF